MAGILAARPHQHFSASCRRYLQNDISPGWWRRDLGLSSSTRILPRPYPWGQPIPRTLLWATRPRWLTVFAPPQRAQDQKSNTEEFRLIYRFPGIRYCRAISRLKLLQTALTVAILPPMWFFYWQDQVTQAQCLYSTAIACFAAAMLYGMSFYLRRIIGMMYLSRDGSVLKIAHLTFWGGRRDISCPVRSVMTLGDTGENPNELLLRFKQFDKEQFLYFTLRFGQVVDREGFVKVFGSLG
ncbi:transmembrane protein 186 [Hemicordylus capensis]|uniref:transmembrane protein 186 n=1 Tax=Hemicordylus capensis TaxID=884348 RepID=UPI00230263D1|nr:transmembrane protein 186 [Hemicordylus capensis]